MDTIFFHGRIHTMDDSGRVVEALGVEDGKVAFLGSDREAAHIECRERIDLKGRFVLPGFADSHMHLLHYAYTETSVTLNGSRSVEEVLDRVRQYLAAHPTCTGLFARGWNEDEFDEPRYPTKEEVEALNPDIPICLARVCGHVAVVNRRGLEKLKARPEFGDFAGQIREDKGIITENAVQYYRGVLDSPSEQEIKNLLTYGVSKLHEAGITSVQSDDLSSLPGKDAGRVLAACQGLDREGGLAVDYYEQCLFERYQDLETFIGKGYRTGQTGSSFTIGPVKLIQDGSLGARTAALCEPYEGELENRGESIFDQETLNRFFVLADQNAMQVAVHCIGDRAMDMTLQAIAQSGGRKQNPKNRHGLVHVQISNRKILERMRALDVLAYIQPVFIDYDMNIVEERIGRRRMDGIYAWKSMLDLGLHASGGSDAPVVSFDVLENIYYAVTRKNRKGEPKGGWIPEERLSVDQAIRLFTRGSAYARYQEDESGSLEPGKWANMVLLSDDLYAIRPEAIKDVHVLETIYRGKSVYRFV